MDDKTKEPSWARADSPEGREAEIRRIVREELRTLGMIDENGQPPIKFLPDELPHHDEVRGILRGAHDDPATIDGKQPTQAMIDAGTEALVEFVEDDGSTAPERVAAVWQAMEAVRPGLPFGPERDLGDPEVFRYCRPDGTPPLWRIPAEAAKPQGHKGKP